MGLSGGTLDPWNFKTKDDWLDPVLAARFKAKFTPQLQANIMGDYSSWGSSDETYQVLATANYDFRTNWSVTGGYRYLRIDQETHGIDYRLEMSGPLIGVSYKF